MKFLTSKNKKAPLICFFTFAVWQMLVLIRFNGMYSYDETYHAFAANSYYNSIATYNRAPYINGMIALLGKLFGQSYYVYKAVPYLMSLISIGLLLYVLYQYVEHNYSLILFTVLVCLHSSILFIHIYIRMYVYDEAFTGMAAALLVLLSKVTQKWKKVIVVAAYMVVSFLLFIIQPTEQSSWLLAIICMMALVGNVCAKPILTVINNKRLELPFISFLTIILITTIVLFVCIKQGIIMLPFHIVHIDRGSEFPWLLRHIGKGNMLICLGMLLMGIRIIYGKYTAKANIVGVYLLGLIPLLLFLIVYYDNFILRALSVYLPVMIVSTCIWIDSVRWRPVSIALVGVLYLLNIYKSQADLNIREYAKSPYIQWETGMNDYGGMIKETQKAIDEGRKSICFWKSRNDMAMFPELTERSDVDLCLEDDNNSFLGEVTPDVLRDLLAELDSTDESYVVMIAPIVESRISNPKYKEEYCPEFLETLQHKYECKEFMAQSFCGVFYVN